MSKSFKHILGLIIFLVLINITSSSFFVRQDFTHDKRYSLSNYSQVLTDKLNKSVHLEIYLNGDMPSEYKRLQREIRYLLEEYAAYNPLIKFSFINPIDDGKNAMEVANQFYQNGMSPKVLNQMKNGEMSEKIIFPWAVASFGEQKIPVSLLSKNTQVDTENLINTSIQEIEYQITNALKILTQNKSKKIAIIKGQGELEDMYIADAFRSLKNYYYIAPFTLDSVQSNPQKTFEELSDFDLIVEAKPQKAFSEEKKHLIDQYIMQGGSAIWLTEHVTAEQDSLMKNQSLFALPKDLNLHDLFFEYGIRINPQLVKDLYCAPISLATGSGRDTEINQFPWLYAPLSQRNQPHIITKNLLPIKFDYANPIDTLKNDLKKEILLQSSPLSQIVGVPKEINLNLIQQKPNPEDFRNDRQNLAVLVEGEFKSAYKNRLKPFDLNNQKDDGVFTSQAFISDGDVIKNEVSKGEILELGFDRLSGNAYGNKQFLINLTNYMLGDKDLVSLRNKSIKTANFDQAKVKNSKTKWQIINIALAPFLMIVFGALMFFLKRRKYVKS
ncbi:MAG: gliding motility-associated ABC transporter substrate-binding protein GldG [Psychroflexus sp.]